MVRPRTDARASFYFGQYFSSEPFFTDTSPVACALHIASRVDEIAAKCASILSILRVLPASGPDFRVGALIFSRHRPRGAAGGNHEYETEGCADGRSAASEAVRALAREQGSGT